MRDDAYLLDMLNAARRAKTFVASMSQDAFVASELHQSAVVKQLEIIGEAARRVSDAFQNRAPGDSVAADCRNEKPADSRLYKNRRRNGLGDRAARSRPLIAQLETWESQSAP